MQSIDRHKLNLKLGLGGAGEQLGVMRIVIISHKFHTENNLKKAKLISSDDNQTNMLLDRQVVWILKIYDKIYFLLNRHLHKNQATNAAITTQAARTPGRSKYNALLRLIKKFYARKIIYGFRAPIREEKHH